VIKFSPLQVVDGRDEKGEKGKGVINFQIVFKKSKQIFESG
jgi:hypothetical protein